MMKEQRRLLVAKLITAMNATAGGSNYAMSMNHEEAELLERLLSEYEERVQTGERIAALDGVTQPAPTRAIELGEPKALQEASETGLVLWRHGQNSGYVAAGMAGVQRIAVFQQEAIMTVNAFDKDGACVHLHIGLAAWAAIRQHVEREFLADITYRVGKRGQG